MLSFYVVGREHRHETSRSSGFFDGRTAFKFLALHQAHDSAEFEAVFASSLYGLNRRSTRCAHVIHDDHARAFRMKALDPSTCPMRLFGFADEERVDVVLLDVFLCT